MNLLLTAILKNKKYEKIYIMNKKKKHADFQDEYRKSSNFGKTDKKEDLEIKGDGELKLEKDKEMKDKSEKEEIKKTLDKINSEEE